MIRDEQSKLAFDQNEQKVINSAFEFNKISIEKIMKKVDNVYCIEINRIISKDLILEIYQNGYSRIPV